MLQTSELIKSNGSATLLTPRDYQTNILSSVRKGWQEGFRKQLVVSPTGSGKTLLFCWMAKEEFDQNRRTLILVDQDELVFQAVDKLRKATNLIAEVEKAEFKASKMARIVVASVQSMVRRLDQWAPDTFDLVIADEADKSLAKTWQAVLKHFDPTARVCGFTATPLRLDKRSLGEYYDNIAADYSLIQLIKLGHLSNVCVQMAPIKIDISNVGTTTGDWDKNDLDHAITPYLGSVVDAIQQYASDRKTLVFLPLIRTSEAFIKICRERGLAAEHIDGTSEDRKEKLARFARREFSIMANSMLLTRGFDDPTIDCIVVLRLTKSISLYQQMCGRGTRLAEGKKNMLLLDLLWQSDKHMVCRPASLIAGTEEEADQMTEISENEGGESDLLELQGKATSAREEALRKKLEAVANRKARFISAEEFAIQHHQMEIAEYEPTMHWEFEPVSPKQLAVLEKANINPDTVKGKGHAHKILDVVFKEWNAEPASNAQRWRMRQSGWVSKDGLRGPSEATKGDAKDFFASFNKKAA